jgi:superfamily II DNA/RNA helicase
LTFFNEGCNILIATPGRLKDFVGRSKVLMENVQYFVMDEADRLLDLGFSEVIREIGYPKISQCVNLTTHRANYF